MTDNAKGIVENAVGYIKKNFLSGLELGDFKTINPAAAHWLDSIANVRNHGETRKRPKDMLAEEITYLSPLPQEPYDIGTVCQMRATSQFRVILDTNRYSVPAEYTRTRLTVKTYPDRLCIYHDNKLIARHTRSYDRCQDIENPDHPKALLQYRRKARDQKILMRFLTLSQNSERYYQGLLERKLNVMHHIRQIVGLSEIHPKEQVIRAIEDALEYRAFSCDYIANLLEQRKYFSEPQGALHLTRASDLLDLEIKAPDLNVYIRRTDNGQ